MDARRGASGSTMYCDLSAVALGGGSSTATGVTVAQASISSTGGANLFASAVASTSAMCGCESFLIAALFRRELKFCACVRRVHRVAVVRLGDVLTPDFRRGRIAWF